MASKLSVYNGALLVLGERKLAALTESRASRRRLDTVWDGDTGVQYCLGQGLWNFAMRTSSFTFSPSIEPDFGYTYAFTKPDDWVRTARMSDDERFCNLLDFDDEQALWFADQDTIYTKYVSKNDEYGFDLSLWTPAFTEYVEHHFAAKICKATTGSDDETERVTALAEKKLRWARSQDAMNEGPKEPPRGSWSRARRGGGGSTNDRGPTGRLLG